MDDPIRVMIVDDETLVRNLVRKSVNWQALGLVVVAEAANATEALDLIEETRPQILLTDIQMPYLDGIDFAGKVLEQDPDVRIIILTGYDEFEYARRSIQAGVSDFLLKPVNPEELEHALRKNAREIIELRKRLADDAALRQQLTDVRPYLVERYFQGLIHQGHPNQELTTADGSYYGIQFQPGHFQIAVLAMNKTEGNGSNPEEKLLLSIFRIRDLVSSHLDRWPQVYVFMDVTNKMVVLSNQSALDLVHFCESIRRLAEESGLGRLCAGVGNPYAILDQVRYSYLEAMEAFDYLSFSGTERILSFAEIDYSGKAEPENSKEQIDRLGFYIRAGSLERANEQIEQLFALPFSHGRDSLDQIRVLSAQILSGILGSIASASLRSESFLGDGTGAFATIYQLSTLAELRDYFTHLISEIIREINRNKLRVTHKLVEDVLAAIQLKLTERDLGLKSLASQFYINPSYLSRVFKQETGRTLVQHIFESRMQKAMELIDHSDLRTYQIAETLGFSDPSYFSTSFKKYTGMTVNEYKNKVQRTDDLVK